MAPGGGRDFNCPWEKCGKSFNRKSDLGRHYRIHTNERPYHCTHENCNKSFIQRSALTVHSRTHTGEKPHVCDHEGCQKAFSDSSSLARHRRIHTGKRPYICQEPTCDRTFCRKTTLTKHQHRSHQSGSTRLSSEEATPEGTPYQAPVPTSVQYSLGGQESFYPPPTPSHEYFQSMPLPPEPLPIPTQQAPTQVPVNLQYAALMQQRFDPSRGPYPPTGYNQHPQYTGQQVSSGDYPLMVYPQDQPKLTERFLNQTGEFDWTFLGLS